MTNVTLLITAARSGSNRVCELASSDPSVYSKYEIFHPLNAWEVTPDDISFFNLAANKNFALQQDSKEEAFAEFRRKNPPRYLELLRGRTASLGKSVLFAKIFPGQLETDAVAKVLASPFVKPVFLTRNTADTFISGEKAAILGKYQALDTSEMKLDFDWERFREYHEQLVNWFQNCRRLVTPSGLPINRITYEKLFNGVEKDSQTLNAFFKSAGVEIATSADAAYFKRQDRNNDWQLKINNTAEVLDHLSKCPLDLTLDQVFES